IFAPGDAVADFERVTSHVLFDSGAYLLDHADDLVAENARTGIRTPAFVRVDVGTADRRHRDLHQYLSGLGGTQRIGLDNEGRIRRLVDSRLSAASHILRSSPAFAWGAYLRCHAVDREIEDLIVMQPAARRPARHTH